MEDTGICAGRRVASTCHMPHATAQRSAWQAEPHSQLECLAWVVHVQAAAAPEKPQSWRQCMCTHHAAIFSMDGVTGLPAARAFSNISVPGPRLWQQWTGGSRHRWARPWDAQCSPRGAEELLAHSQPSQSAVVAAQALCARKYSLASGLSILRACHHQWLAVWAQVLYCGLQRKQHAVVRTASPPAARWPPILFALKMPPSSYSGV